MKDKMYIENKGYSSIIALQLKNSYCIECILLYELPNQKKFLQRQMSHNINITFFAMHKVLSPCLAYSVIYR